MKPVLTHFVKTEVLPTLAGAEEFIGRFSTDSKYVPILSSAIEGRLPELISSVKWTGYEPWSTSHEVAGAHYVTRILSNQSKLDNIRVTDAHRLDEHVLCLEVSAAITLNYAIECWIVDRPGRIRQNPVPPNSVSEESSPVTFKLIVLFDLKNNKVASADVVNYESQWPKPYRGS